MISGVVWCKITPGMEQFEQQYFTEQYNILPRTEDLFNLYNRNIFKTSLYIYIFQDEKCRLMRNLSLSMDMTSWWYLPFCP